jgi:hypothetical protein
VFLQFEDRKSTSPFVERIWRCKSGAGGTFLSTAEGNIELVITRLPRFLAVTLRGPVSKGTLVECPPDDLTWEIPKYENAEVFVNRLARAGVIARSHATDAAVERDVDWMSRRSVQRHFRRVTGMTFGGSRHQWPDRRPLDVDPLRIALRHAERPLRHALDDYDPANGERLINKFWRARPVGNLRGSSARARVAQVRNMKGQE